MDAMMNARRNLPLGDEARAEGIIGYESKYL